MIDVLFDIQIGFMILNLFLLTKGNNICSILEALTIHGQLFFPYFMLQYDPWSIMNSLTMVVPKVRLDNAIAMWQVH
jgi:hypothetical protein